MAEVKPISGRSAADGMRFELVDAMRALAALSVLVFHVSHTFGPPSPGVEPYLTQRNAGSPVPGVVVFFVISGFVLYRPFVKARFEDGSAPQLVPYAVRRVARIVPLYWFVLALATVWLGLQEVQSVTGVVRYFGFLQLYGPGDVVLGGLAPAWTLCVEVTFYASVPLVALLMRRRFSGRSVLRSELALCAVLWALSLAWAAAFLLVEPGGRPWLVPLLTTLPGMAGLFALGMAMAAVSVALERGEIRPRWVTWLDRAPWAAWIGAAVALWLVGRAFALADDRFGLWWMTTLPLKALAAVLLLAPVVFGTLDRGWLRRGLGWAPLLWLGAISYGIYLWHTPLLEGFDTLVGGGGIARGLLVLVALTVAASAITYYAIERPAQRLARRRLARRAAPVPGPVPATVAEPVPADAR